MFGEIANKHERKKRSSATKIRCYKTSQGLLYFEHSGEDVNPNLLSLTLEGQVSVRNLEISTSSFLLIVDFFL
ncbi:hypothetical protein CDAR_393821 [Caerostris darwini]|uniref:Uncharacterized protein n=1 Tax=Caerostris darwini TaxID=1538125 RepID=A0AAV4PIP7_9ARAC|nr:hypothetical protein CDAR_393821 [Caerostris darwini]